MFPKYVVKRNGKLEEISFSKITTRLELLCNGLNMDYVNLDDITRIVKDGITEKMTTEDIDHLSSAAAYSNVTVHPDYGLLAGRIEMSNLHKKVPNYFSSVMYILSKLDKCQLNDKYIQFVKAHWEDLDKAILSENDMTYDYFAFKTLARSYLLRHPHTGEILESPQYLLMRVAITVNNVENSESPPSLSDVIGTYRMLSNKLFTFATPTLYNAGTKYQQLASCFLMDIKEDSLDGIYKSLTDCAMISKHAGGIGMSIHKIRATDSPIQGTGGKSNGIIPMIRVFNDTARYVDQGGGKRKGSFAVYIEPWHMDIEEFLELKKNHGKEEARARDLFYGLWIPDLFMKRVKEPEGKWTLFDPADVPGLYDSWGDDFEELYTKYENEVVNRKTFDAAYLWKQITNSITETGQPYILFKDSCNRKSNHKHLGTIKSSNLCTEIIQYTSEDEVAVCNLASLNLVPMVKDGEIDFELIMKTTREMTRCLNNVIDVNKYPIPESLNSNMKHRPIGIGIQGLADIFAILELPFESKEALDANRLVFEHMYFAAIEESVELAKKYGAYQSFEGSPMSKGIFQYDMWNEQPVTKDKLDWDGLKEKVKEHGTRNSLFIAPMPTASTSQILGNHPCFEAFPSIIYNRGTSAGEFTILNKHFVDKMIELGFWNTKITSNDIDAAHGSIQDFDFIPKHVRNVYKITWEIKQRSVIDMAVSRGPFVDQSQSMNLHFQSATYSKLTSALFYGWEKGLKTGSYYVRTLPKAHAIQFTVDKTMKRNASYKSVSEECEMCSA